MPSSIVIQLAHAPLAPRSLLLRSLPRRHPRPSSSTTFSSASDTTKKTEQQQPSPQDLACYGTGAEVECVVPEYKDAVPTPSRRPLESTPPTPLSPFLDTLLLISPFFFWGTSMVAMKELGPPITPLFLAAWRLIPAGGALLTRALTAGRKQPSGGMAWLAIALFGLADGAMFQGFLAEGLQRTSAGLGSVIIDSQPLTVAVLASLLFGERLGAGGVVGLGLGVAGLLLLEVPPSLLSSLPETISGAVTSGALEVTTTISTTTTSSSWSIWDSGEWWMLLAAQSMAVGTVMVRWVAKYCDPVIATGWHMILGGIPLAVLALAQDGGELSVKLAEINAQDVGLLLYVSLLGSAASYGVFFYEATVRGNLTSLSSLTFLTPMFAAAGGYFALGESLTPLQLVGATVTLGAVTLLNSGGGDGGGGSEENKD